MTDAATEILFDRYRAAFRVSTGGLEPPNLNYERGWVRIGDGRMRVRRAMLLQMTRTLEARADAKQRAGITAAQVAGVGR